jgi:hypothetical protein
MTRAGPRRSTTLYDTDNGFVMPNDRKKYSVGENGRMKLNDEHGIEVYVAAEKPEGVPEEKCYHCNHRFPYEVLVNG